MMAASVDPTSCEALAAGLTAPPPPAVLLTGSYVNQLLREELHLHPAPSPAPWAAAAVTAAAAAVACCSSTAPGVSAASAPEQESADVANDSSDVTLPAVPAAHDAAYLSGSLRILKMTHSFTVVRPCFNILRTAESLWAPYLGARAGLPSSQWRSGARAISRRHLAAGTQCRADSRLPVMSVAGNLQQRLACVLAVCAALVTATPVPRGDSAADLLPSCDSKVYCQGELLDVIQNAGLYKDSKTFVDLRMIYSPGETLEQFDVLMQQTGRKPSKDQLRNFVNNYFQQGNELESTDIPDWVENPKLLNRITDVRLKEWAFELNHRWKNLSKKVSTEVKEKSDRYSLIYVPNHFIVPGGRFRELYYWDSYWIVRGLLLSDMTSTVKGILENFLYLLDNYGIIPNGGRIYYLQRTQPPLLTPMVYNYLVATKDTEFVRKNIFLLEKEFDFWMKNRTVQIEKDGKTYTLARYYCPSQGPRPESYREDYQNGQVFSTDQRKLEFYIDLKSAAESGWDFSSRWFIKDGQNKGNLTDIHTKYIIPVDINAFIYGNAHMLDKMFRILGNSDKAHYYSQIAKKWKEAVTEVLWNDTLGSWFDYDMLNKKQRTYFYPSNIAPLWTKCYNEEKSSLVAQKVVKYLNGIDILHHYLGGIPTSLNNTGEQWDMPNAWPPLQNILIQGLESTQEPSAQELAFKYAEQWVQSNYKGYKETDAMYEKYDAEVPGQYGGGGEYTVQEGFGWTNGVILELLDTYGRILTADRNRLEKRS